MQLFKDSGDLNFRLAVDKVFILYLSLFPWVSLDSVEHDKFSSVGGKSYFIKEENVKGFYLHLFSVMCSNIIPWCLLSCVNLLRWASDDEMIYTHLQDSSSVWC